MRRALAAGSLLLALAGAGVAPGTASARTKVTVFHAFRAGGRPAVKATVVPGLAACSVRSEVAPRRDAWFCNVPVKTGRYAQRIIDPCFVSPADASKLLCPSRDLRSGYEISVAVPMRHSPAPRHGGAKPFNVQLTNGDHCVFNGPRSSTLSINGIRDNYDCPGGLGLWGGFDEKRQPWTISAFAEKSSVPHFGRRRAIVHVWR